LLQFLRFSGRCEPLHHRLRRRPPPLQGGLSSAFRSDYFCACPNRAGRAAGRCRSDDQGRRHHGWGGPADSAGADICWSSQTTKGV